MALVLQTSGTTSRPKTVPLTHRNIFHSVNNIIGTYALSPGRPLPEHDALVSYPRPDRGPGGFAGLRRERDLRPGIPARPGAGLADRAAIRPGTRPSPPCTRRSLNRFGAIRKLPGKTKPALHPFVFVRAGSAGGAGAGGGLRRTRAGSLRHDRSHPPDRQQPAPAAPAQVRVGRPGDRHHPDRHPG